MANDHIKLAQLNNSGEALKLIAGRDNLCPEGIVAGSCQWQSWAIEVLKESFSKEGFKGRNVVVSIPADEVFIDLMKMPNCSKEKLDETVLSKLKQKLPFDSANAIIKCVETELDNLIVFVTEREKINRHLAIFEKNDLQLKSMCTWPMALTNCYGTFFGRRQTDIDSIVFLVDIGSKVTNVVISRHTKPLFARSILI
ncbi:MAG TPA: pilus assembly protein PilM, partial [Sedimentisphaerales bacterium]|nr:pilus assembly protein PilM [Sedimentisphaerales bacterium]